MGGLRVRTHQRAFHVECVLLDEVLSVCGVGNGGERGIQRRGVGRASPNSRAHGNNNTRREMRPRSPPWGVGGARTREPLILLFLSGQRCHARSGHDAVRAERVAGRARPGVRSSICAGRVKRCPGGRCRVRNDEFASVRNFITRSSERGRVKDRRRRLSAGPHVRTASRTSRATTLFHHNTLSTTRPPPRELTSTRRAPP